MTIAPNIPQNWSPPMAPIKPPFLWNAPQGDVDTVERKQFKIRSLATYGETMGVYMSMDLTSKTPEEGLFDSNARLLNLEKIEDLLNRLAPPKWPEEVLWKDRPRESGERQEAIRQPLCGVPQFLSLYLDRTEQVRQALP